MVAMSINYHSNPKSCTKSPLFFFCFYWTGLIFRVVLFDESILLVKQLINQNIIND